ncbi:MAG: hypothetical protein MZV64_24275 [Ignavibacteriales bacterium]|nr:hypothetical protein [Ignavibacteriales bacterium]
MNSPFWMSAATNSDYVRCQLGPKDRSRRLDLPGPQPGRPTSPIPERVAVRGAHRGQE